MNIRFRLPHHRIVGSTKQAVAVQLALKDAFPLQHEAIVKRADNDMHGVTRIVCTADQFAAFILARTKHGAQNMMAELYSEKAKAPPKENHPDHFVTDEAIKAGYIVTPKVSFSYIDMGILPDSWVKRRFMGCDYGREPGWFVMDFKNIDEKIIATLRSKAEVAAEMLGHTTGEKNAARAAFMQGARTYGDANFWPHQEREIGKREELAMGYSAGLGKTYHWVWEQIQREAELQAEIERKAAHGKRLDELKQHLTKLVSSGVINTYQIKEVHKEFGVTRVGELRLEEIDRYQKRVDERVAEIAKQREADLEEQVRGIDPKLRERIRDKAIEEIAADFDRRAERLRKNITGYNDTHFGRKARIRSKQAIGRNEYNAKLVRSMKGGVTMAEATRRADATHFRDQYLRKVRMKEKYPKLVVRPFRFAVPVQYCHDGSMYMEGQFESSTTVKFNNFLPWDWLDERIDWTKARPAPLTVPSYTPRWGFCPSSRYRK